MAESAAWIPTLRALTETEEKHKAMKQNESKIQKLMHGHCLNLGTKTIEKSTEI